MSSELPKSEPKPTPKIRQRAEQRLRIIEALIPLYRNNTLRPADIAAVADRHNLHPRTLQRWLKSYALNGFNGLYAHYKGAAAVSRLKSGFSRLLEEAKLMRKQDPYISVAVIIRSLESAYPECRNILKRATLQRHLQLAGYSRRDLLFQVRSEGRRVYGRYRKTMVLQQVQGDVKEFPEGIFIDDKTNQPCKLFVQVLLDNASRYILSFKCAIVQDRQIILDPLRKLIAAHGTPQSLLLDNGSIYRCGALLFACRYLGIKVKYCRPYKPEGKGAIERLNGTLDSLENQLLSLKRGNIPVPVSMGIMAVEQWVTEYNNLPHKALLPGMSPLMAFNALPSVGHLVSPEVIDQAFRRSFIRRVAKDGSISWNDCLYQIPPRRAFPGHEVEILVDNNNNLELVLPDSTTVPIFPMQAPPDVPAEILQACHPSAPPISLERAGHFLALLRERYRATGNYHDESQFLREISQRFAKVAQTLGLLPSLGELSPYGKMGSHHTPAPPVSESAPKAAAAKDMPAAAGQSDPKSREES